MKYLKLFENMSKELKPIHHMTLSEYKDQVIPLIVELKKILRKKFLLPTPESYYPSFNYLPKKEWIEAYINKQLKFWERSPYGDKQDFINKEKERALIRWDKEGGKDKIDQKLYDRFLEIKNILEPLYLESQKIDLSKAHRDNKKEVREALTSNTYVNEIKSGKLSYTDMEEICDSHNIKIPKRVVELKQRYEGKSGDYARRVLNANKKFKETIKEHLSQYIEELKDIKRINLTSRVKGFLEEKHDRFTKHLDGELISLLNYNYDNEKWERIKGFDQVVETKCVEYAESYIFTFISRLENKTNVINTKLGIPDIEFSETSFKSGQLETNFKLTYSDGTELTGYCNVIIAGGYVQTLHQRYLFHFYLNGKKVSLQQIDKFR
jgi:hypothetical protein